MSVLTVGTKVGGCGRNAESLISKMNDFEMISVEECWGRGGKNIESVKYLMDTDLSFIPEVSLEIHQVQGPGERPGPALWEAHLLVG